MKRDIRIADDVRAVIDRSVVEGNLLRLPPEQLDRKLCVDVNKALEALGGKWNRSKKAHVFESDPRAAIEEAIEEGKVAHPNQHDFFPTSREVAEIACRRLNAERHHRILEPSVGEGHLLEPLIDWLGKPSVGDLVVYERDPRRFAGLHKRGIGPEFLVAADFLGAAPPAAKLFDRVLMNPPFERGSDAKHIAHALGFLAPGGRLVAIASAAFKKRTDKAGKAIRATVASWGGTVDIEDLPEGSFEHAGTSISTVLVVVDRPTSS